MKLATCPSCGALVTFRSAASIMAVCEYCRGTLIRHDEAIEDIGRMAELLTDALPIQIGTAGYYLGDYFTVIGRIQLQYEQGVWNEWYVLFDDQRSAWLTDASGEYAISFIASSVGALPAINSLAPGDSVTLNGVLYTVTDIEHAICIAGAGELPFRVGSGFSVPSVDMRSGLYRATIDYSEEPPLLFLGTLVEFDDLRLTNLRDVAEIGIGYIKTRSFQCPACGSAIAINTPNVQSLTCGSCHTLISAENDNLKVLHKFAKEVRVEPRIPLGSEGSFDGTRYRVIGYMARSSFSDGTESGWDEYLLHNPMHGFRWLTEYQGHWNFASPVKGTPEKSYTIQGAPAMLSDGRLYRHFEKSSAKVTYVLGEFYWRVAINEKATVNDYIAPPYILSEEKNGKEITWTAGEYIEPEVVQNAFDLTEPLPQRYGVAPNQIWPQEAAYRQVWQSFWICTLLVVLIQIISLKYADDRTIYTGNFHFPSDNGEPQTSPEFEVPGSTGNLHFITQANVDNDWAGVDLELIDRDTGRVRSLSREVSYYHGYDDGYWTEGNGSDEAEISDVPPGHYLLRIDAEKGNAYNRAFDTRLEIHRNVPNWKNCFVIEALLLLFPIIFWWWRATFEAERWSGGDHPEDTPGEKLIAALTD